MGDKRVAHIIVCSDGTWNKPEERARQTKQRDFPTNILKIARSIAPELEQVKQHVFYDWGIGAYHSSWLAGMTGKGIEKNITDGYRYIVQNYSAGDKIFLFGFSRGAYTVRALSGLINNIGILKREHAARIAEAWSIYKRAQKKYSPAGAAAVTFKSKFSHAAKEIHFVGVFDTVGALGIPRSLIGLFSDKDEFYDTEIGSNVAIARHALAIDEQRTDFEPTLWMRKEGLDLKQVWFAGVHSDIGGSYPPGRDGSLASDVPLKWMLNQARDAGLMTEAHVTERLNSHATSTLHNSRKHIYRLSPIRYRPLAYDVQKPTTIHESVKQRYDADQTYRPKALNSLLASEGWPALEVD
jgi:uncharacterized protein (DUF2235 family)